MKVFVAIVGLSGVLLGQGRVGPVGHGFGNVVFPGGPPAPSGHIPNLSSSIRGVYPAGPVQPGRPGLGRPHQRPPVVVPVPVYVGGYGYGSGYYGYEPQVPMQPNVTVVNEPPQSPSVIINQGYTPDRGQPVMREYSQETGLNSYQAPVPSHPEPVKPGPVAINNDDSPTIYLIAFKDGTMYPAYAYWLEADTLHYITTKHSHNRVSLTLVDEPLSLRLNQERSVEFKLRAAK
jgi:hypothetical protein